MALNLDTIKEKMNVLKNGGSKNNYWKIKEGTHTVRVLPTEDGDPFKSFFFHYGLSQGGLLCPKANYGENCPVCEFVSKLFNEKDPESTEMAKKIMKKQRFFSPVLVRGEEKDGVKVWSYSKTVYEFLLKAVLNPEIGDFCDLESGYDLGIEYGKISGRLFPEVKPEFKRKTSPMCKGISPKECEEILSSIPDLNKLHKKSTTVEVQEALDKFLSGSDAEVVSSDKAETSKTSHDEISSVEAALRSLQD